MQGSSEGTRCPCHPFPCPLTPLTELNNIILGQLLLKPGSHTSQGCPQREGVAIQKVEKERHVGQSKGGKPYLIIALNSHLFPPPLKTEQNDIWKSIDYFAPSL
jgi:hypothetical protein